jgi:ABC-type sugar transport system substrate-binding protein
MSRPQPGYPPSATAERIRGAAGRKASAVIVEAPDDPALTAALNDVRAAGVPVVALGRKVPTRDLARPLASVTFTPYEETARQVVDTLVRDARDRGLSGGHALIPLNIRSDPGRDQEVAVLLRLLRSAGVSDVQTVPFDDDWNKARKLLTERILADPAVALLLSHEDKGLDAAVGAIDDVRSQRELGLAGFTIVDPAFNSATFNRGSAIADRNIPVFIHRAVRLAVALARGEVTKEDVVVDRPLHINTRAASPAPKDAPPVTDPHSTKKG